MALRRRRASRLEPSARREQLLRCAVRVFGRRGLGRGTHADVAAEAGVAVPTVFTYFHTRADLVASVLQAVEQYYDDMAGRHHRPDVPAARALVDHALAFAASVDTHLDHVRILLEWSAALRDEIWPRYLAYNHRMVDRFRETIRRGQEEGTLAAALDPDDAAHMIVGAWQGVAQMKLTHHPPEKVHRFLLALLRGAIGAEAVADALV